MSSVSINLSGRRISISYLQHTSNSKIGIQGFQVAHIRALHQNRIATLHVIMLHACSRSVTTAPGRIITFEKARIPSQSGWLWLVQPDCGDIQCWRGGSGRLDNTTRQCMRSNMTTNMAVNTTTTTNKTTTVRRADMECSRRQDCRTHRYFKTQNTYPEQSSVYLLRILRSHHIFYSLEEPLI